MRSASSEPASSTLHRRKLLVAVECAVVAGLLLVWLLSAEVRRSRNLWVLFFYSFPSEFLVGLVPHEPVLIYFGSFHAAEVVALVAAIGTVLAEAMNYLMFGYLYDLPSLRSLFDHRAIQGTRRRFGRVPFATILFAGFSPVPFFPVRFLVVMTGYPLWRYLLGVFVSRTPRFYILAAFGAYLDIPIGVLAGLFLVLLLSVNVPAIVRLITSAGRTQRER
jgi:membrane protein YqaA with SNARE-associated domain